MIGPILGGVIALLTLIGAARVIKVGGMVIRRALARTGRALARLEIDTWCGEVARATSDATIVTPPPKGRKIRGAA